MNIIIFFIILLVLVLVHEFGHFFSAKRFGIRVDEFGFGFPPKLFGKKYGETEYSLNLFPVGGFVKIFGENPDEENISGPDAGRSFVNKPKWQQIIVLFSGIFANFLFAWLLFSISFMSGLPTSVGNEPEGYSVTGANLVVVSVLPGSPAEIAGLKTGDKIVSVYSADGSLEKVNTETFKSFIVSHPNKEISVAYLRGKSNTMNVVKATPLASGIGIAMDEIGILKLPFFKALEEGLSLDWSVTKDTVSGIYNLIVRAIEGKGSLSSVTGPVGMIAIVGNAFQFGFVYLLSFTALISVNLAVINLVPFPALDGGRILFVLIEKIKGSSMNPKVANAVNTVGFALLIILMLLITYHDVVRLF